MATRLIALLLLALGFLPLANWIPGGAEDLEYGPRMLDWLYGIGLCAGIGLLAWYIARARRPAVVTPQRSPATPAHWAGDIAIATAAACLYALIAKVVFSGRPLLIDEIVQVLQARWYASGELSVATPLPAEFYSILHLVDLGPRTFSQFPAGGPAMLALGSLVGAEWLVGPVFGGASVLLFSRLLRRLEPGASFAWYRGATALFAIAPFGAFMFGSHMNHATTLTWLLVAMMGLARCVERDDSAPVWGFVAGVGLGVAATIRPVDAAAFAVPAAAWLLWRSRSGGRPLAQLLLSGVGVATPVALLLWVNARTTGEPLLFGYDLLWGPGHSLGFHRSPWGPEHTPLRGLELLGLYFTRLSTYLFETPYPALLPAIATLALWREVRALDRYLIASAALLLLAYGAYWHDGFYLGPRFVFPLLPMLVLWSARLPLAIAARVRLSRPAGLGVRAALWSGALYAVVTVVAVRAPQYRNGMTSMRTPIEQRSAAAGVTNALVLVQESWGARLVARMWALGIPRSDTEVLYRTVDACRLEVALGELEASGARGIAARDRLAPLRADSALLVKSSRSPDFTERMLPGLAYASACETEIARDAEGFSHLAPLRLAQDGNVYVRWLPGREREIMAQYPDRAAYLLGRDGTAVESLLRWTPLDR